MKGQRRRKKIRKRGGERDFCGHLRYSVVFDLQLHPQRVLISLIIPDSPGHWEGGMVGGNGGDPLIVLPLTSLRHISLSSFFISSHLLYVIHTELHPVSGAFTKIPGTRSLYTRHTLCLQLTPPSLSPQLVHFCSFFRCLSDIASFLEQEVFFCASMAPSIPTLSFVFGLYYSVLNPWPES